MPKGLDYTIAEDRLLLLKMAIKCADISNAAKPRGIYMKWTERVIREFYQQGDQEKERGLPISTFMDRDNPNIRKLQLGFLNFIVMPTFKTWLSFLKHEEILHYAEENLKMWLEATDVA